MQKAILVDCPTYLELELKNGQVNGVNGKELNGEGVKHVIEYLCNEVGVQVDDVLSKVKALGKDNGEVKLKLHNGAVSAL